MLAPMRMPSMNNHGFVPHCLSAVHPRNVSPIVGINIRQVVSAIVLSMKTTGERSGVVGSSFLSGEVIYVYTVTDIKAHANPLETHETQDTTRRSQQTPPLRREALLFIKTRGRNRQIRARNHHARPRTIYI